MKQARHLLMLALCCLCSLGLAAQSFSAEGGPELVPLEGTGGGAYVDQFQSFSFDVTAEGTIGEDIEITGLQLFIDHTWVGDLFIVLVNPDGIESVVTTGSGGNNDGYAGYTYADSAAIAVENGVPGEDALTLSARPLFPFNAMFGGDEVTGTWEIRMFDAVGGDSGEFLAANLFFGPATDLTPTNQQEVNLATISEINLTLNAEDNQGMVIPEMVLIGDFNEDGDSIDVTSENFEIVVFDGDQSNGPIVDGCGSFTYMITARDPGFDITNGFVDAFDPDGANVQVTAGPDATATFEGASLTMTSTGADSPVVEDDDVIVDITFIETGFVGFSYDVDLPTDGASFDFAVINFEGEPIYQLPQVEGSLLQDRGRISDIEVAPGNTLQFALIGGDVPNQFVSTFIIDDFRFIATPTMAPLEVVGFTTGWGTVNAEDKTAPVLVETPFNVNDLVCVDVESNNINALGPEVSKCYLVTAATGATIPGTMEPALRAILSPDALEDTAPDTALVPIFFDAGAGVLEVCVSDIVTPSADGCGATVITRTFRAGLQEGAAETCPSNNPDEPSANATEVVASFNLVFVRPTLDSLNGSNIQPTVEIEACGSETSPLEFLPTENDFPFIDFGGRTLSLNSDEAMCSSIVTTFENSPNPIQTCPFTFKFQRTFTVVDWCEPTNVETFTQFVAVGDNTGPMFTGPAMTTNPDGLADNIITYRTNVSGECSALVRLDGAGIGATDICSGSNVGITVSIFPEGDMTQAPFGAYEVDLNDGDAELSDALPVGDYAFAYTSTDECGNQTVSMVPFVVVDGAGPQAVCEDGLNISLSRPAGLAVITPETIDKGSSDDCSDNLTFQIGSSDGPEGMGGSFDDDIVFTCDSIGTRYVVLMVQDENENANTCWLEVTVELKTDDVPTCVAPSNVTMTCTEVSAALPTGNLVESTVAELDAAFGSASGSGTCGATITSELTNSTLNECGIGTIVRTFETTDPQGVTNTGQCAQLITVAGVYDYQIIFPGNARTNECMGEFEADELEIVGGDCDLPMVTPVTEQVLGTPGDECYQIRTTYTVINMCEYDPAFGSTTLITRDGLDVEDTDPIFVNVVSNSSNSDDDDLAFISSSDNSQFTPGDDDDVEVNGYAGSVGRGSFTYVQNIDVFDRVAPVVEVLNAPMDCISGCTADVSLDFTAEDDCELPLDAPILALDPNYNPAVGFEAGSVEGVFVTLSGANGEFTINATNVPAGDHAIMITATDACGNANPVIVEFSVCGDVAPTPLCIQTLVATLADDGMGGGTAEVWATDFLTDSPLLDCFGNDVTKFGIVRAGEGPAAVDQIGLTVTCDDLGEEPIAAEVYAFDDAGNDPTFCTVLIDVQDEDELCGGTGGNIAGTITTTNGEEALRGVAVTISGSSDMEMMETVTNEEGAFEFVRLPLGGDYTVTPANQVAVNLQEVKISDVVMISSVILGSNDFETAYDYLAADVDQSKSLNVLDMVAIQRVILGLDESFVTGDAWGFVPADVEVANPYAQEFPSVYNANDLQANILDADFVGFAYGNVTGEGRTAMNISTADAQLAAGQTHTIEIAATDLVGFQGTFELAAGLELIAADYAGEGAMNLDYAAEGKVAVALRGDVAMSLQVRATEAGLLSELVSLSDAITVREGVAANGANGSVSLTFGAIEAGDAINSLGAAVPNPVVESTLINFTLAADSDVTLSIQDIQGRTVMVRNLRGTAGANAEVVNVADLKGATGVLTYTVTAGDFSATKKMVVVR